MESKESGTLQEHEAPVTLREALGIAVGAFNERIDYRLYCFLDLSSIFIGFHKRVCDNDSLNVVRVAEVDEVLRGVDFSVSSCFIHPSLHW